MTGLTNHISKFTWIRYDSRIISQNSRVASDNRTSDSAAFATQESRQFVLVIEGLDGSGKSGLTALVAQAFRELGQTVYIGDWFRTSDAKSVAMAFNLFGGMSPEVLAALHVTTTKAQIDKARQSGSRIVIWDRYIYSSYASCVGRGLDRSLGRALVELVPEPDLCIVLYEDPEVCYDRIVRRDGIRFFEGNLDKLFRGRIAEGLSEFTDLGFAEGLVREVFLHSGKEWYREVFQIVPEGLSKRINHFQLSDADEMINDILNQFHQTSSVL